MSVLEYARFLSWARRRAMVNRIEIGPCSEEWKADLTRELEQRA